MSGGLGRSAYCENIAWGSGDTATPEAIVDAWMHSSGHRANILSRDFHDLGIGSRQGQPELRRRPRRDLHDGLRPPGRLAARRLRGAGTGPMIGAYAGEV